MLLPDTITTAILGAILGSGFTTWLLQRWVSKKLDAAEEKRKNKAEANEREWLLVKEYRCALGRLLFWQREEINRVQEHTACSPLDGHLEKASKDFQNAERALKDFENKQAASLYRN